MTNSLPCATRTVHVATAGASLIGELACPPAPRGLVVFVEGQDTLAAHALDRGIARALEYAGFATLHLDLFTADEELIDEPAGTVSVNFALLSRRLVQTLEWAADEPLVGHLPVGLFVTGVGAAAALIASVVEQSRVGAIVSTAGRLEAASSVLHRVTTATLLIVSGDDANDTRQSATAARQMPGGRQVVISGATAHFDSGAAFREIGGHTVRWFERHLTARSFAPLPTETAPRDRAARDEPAPLRSRAYRRTQTQCQ